jgi:hypothetical protein
MYGAYMPRLEANGKKLVPASMYLDGLDCYPVVVAKDINEVELWR